MLIDRFGRVIAGHVTRLRCDCLIGRPDLRIFWGALGSISPWGSLSAQPSVRSTARACSSAEVIACVPGEWVARVLEGRARIQEMFPLLLEIGTHDCSRTLPE